MKHSSLIVMLLLNLSLSVQVTVTVVVPDSSQKTISTAVPQCSTAAG